MSRTAAGNATESEIGRKFKFRPCYGRFCSKFFAGAVKGTLSCRCSLLYGNWAAFAAKGPTEVYHECGTNLDRDQSRLVWQRLDAIHPRARTASITYTAQQCAGVTLSSWKRAPSLRVPSREARRPANKHQLTALRTSEGGYPPARIALGPPREALVAWA